MEDSQSLDPTPLPEARKRKVFLPIVIILTVVVIALMVIKASVQKEARLASQPVELNEGSELPNVELNFLDGSTKKLGDLDHKVIMINFWATWCEACIEEMPSIVALREKFKDKGFEVLGINVDENPATAAPPMMKKMNMNFPILTDKSNKLAELFDVHAIPLTVLINSDRKILYVESGERDWNAEDIQQMMTQWLSK